MRYEPFFYSLTGDAGAYATQVPAWFNALLGDLDYIWFLALLGWTLVLALWWWHSRHVAPAGWRWLPWSAAAGVGSALIMLVDFAVARLGATARDAYVRGDVMLTALVAMTCAGWWWEVGRPARGFGRAWCWAMTIVAFAVVPWVMNLPPNATRTQLISLSNFLAVVAVVAAVPWWFKRPGGSWPRCVLTLGALAPVFSTVGPLASYVFFMRHKYSAVGAISVGWGALQGLIAFAALFGLVRLDWVRLAPRRRREVWQEVRPFLGGAIAWLLLGLATAWLVGGRQRRSAEEHALDEARLAVAQLDPAPFASLLGPEFHFNIPLGGAIPYFPPTRLAFSPSLANGGDAAIKRAFLPIARASRTMTHLRFVTLREGWLIGLAGYTSPYMGSLAHYFGAISVDPHTPLRRTSSGYLLMARRASAEDLAEWSRKSEWLEGPLYTPVFSNGVVFARAPVVARDGTMLGWLEFTYLADAFLAETFQSRIAPFVGSTLGVMLTALFFVQRRQAREREAALRAAAVAAEATQMKTDFLAKVSHELRTPLQGILGYGELLQADLPGGIGRSRLSALQQNGAFMLRLVDDLLDLSAIEAGGFRFVENPAALGTLVRETIESLRPRAVAKGLALGCNVAADFPAWLATDGERFRQILLNLAGNALKFTDRGGVEVDLRVREWATDGSCMVELSVRDTGPGVAPGDRAKLFQPFSRLDLTAEKEGTGLGLALSAALCRRHGGELGLDSDGRSGATFRARLKMKTAAAPITDAPAAGLFPTLRGRRVLLADDNPLVRDLFAAWLRDLGAHCEMAEDGEEALARAEAMPFDVIILDLAMPKIDGLTVARRLRARGGPARIVGVSAHASDEDRAQALAAGMDAFLTKPVALGALAAALVATPAPDISEEKYECVRIELVAFFKNEAAGNAAAIRDALARRDYPALRQRAHYLRNSAGVIGDDRLYEACGAVEDAAQAGDRIAAETAWTKCEAALAPWLK